MMKEKGRNLSIMFGSALAMVTVVLALFILLPAVAHAEGPYMVHYETYGILDKKDKIPDLENVGWDQGQLDATEGYNGTDEQNMPISDFFAKYGVHFEGWYIDKELTQPYAASYTYGDLARDPSVTSVTLYPKMSLVKEDWGNVTYKPWVKSDSLPDSPDNYWLVRDVTLEDTDGAAWTAPQGEMRIYLAGHKIIRKESSDAQKGSVIFVPEGAHLTIEDEHEGEITGGDAGDGKRKTAAAWQW